MYILKFKVNEKCLCFILVVIKFIYCKNVFYCIYIGWINFLSIVRECEYCFISNIF